MGSFTVLQNIDARRIVGTKEMQDALVRGLKKELEPLVLPVFKTRIAETLGRTRDAHKYFNTGKVRSPLARRAKGLRPEARGSDTEKKAWVDVSREFSRGAKGRFTAGGATFDLLAGSTASTLDRQHSKLALLYFGRKGRGELKRRVKFWGRRNGPLGTPEGPVRVRQFKHKSLVAKPEVIDSILDDGMHEKITTAFQNVVHRWLAEDKLKGYYTKVRVGVKI